jgi:trans-aconitate methyltransferase
MNELTGMQGHFATVAGVYREMRTTDEEPILHIRDQLSGRPAVRAADIGCGAGRYDHLLFNHLPNLRLACLGPGDAGPALRASRSKWHP